MDPFHIAYVKMNKSKWSKTNVNQHPLNTFIDVCHDFTITILNKQNQNIKFVQGSFYQILSNNCTKIYNGQNSSRYYKARRLITNKILFSHIIDQQDYT